MAVRNVVIGGVTGYIGKHLQHLFSRHGYRVIGVSRSPSRTELTWKDVESNGLPKDIYAVINVAGKNVFQGFWTSKFKQEIRDSRIETTRTLAKAVADTKAECFFTISGVAYYKPDEKQKYTEDDKCEPYDFFSTLCHDWEAAAKIKGNPNIRQVIIRSGVVLGSKSSIDSNMRLPFKLYLGSTIGSGNQYMPWIYITDLTNMFLFSIQNKNISGILNGVAPQLTTNREFTEAYARALGVKPFPMSFPAPAAQFAYGKERAVMLLDGQMVLPQNAVKHGFQFEYHDITRACDAMMNPEPEMEKT